MKSIFSQNQIYSQGNSSGEPGTFSGSGPISQIHDEWLFGWDNLEGIVSVWADRNGRALVWQRVSADLGPSELYPQPIRSHQPNFQAENPTLAADLAARNYKADHSPNQTVRCHQARFRPWVIAAHLDDLRHLGAALVPDVLDSPAVSLASSAAFSYRELAVNKASSSGSDTLRYFISAQDGRALNQAIFTGAEKRLGRPVKTMRELPADEYYWVGPVEQYLMMTGRVYFRSLTYPDLHRLQFDLETTGLSPKENRIFLVAVKDTHGLETILEAPHPNQEARLITELCALIRERNPDVIENHNLFGFDLPFLQHRASVLGVPLRLGRSEAPLQLLEHYEEPAGWGHGKHIRYSVAGRELIDTLDAVRRHDFVARNMSEGHGLKAAARHFGFASPDRTYISGSQIYSTYLHDSEQVRKYAFDDVREVEVLSRHLMGASFALAGMAPRRYERVASAGPATGLLEPMLVRAYVREGYALPRNAAFKDSGLAPHQGGATTLYAGGLAHKVVKADIASMYPSIMRSYRVGPECDPLHSLLYLVDRLTTLRLQHKQAARQALPNSIEWQQHNALQAAMKLVVNSAYGYMAAGKMALFADRQAADEVTRLGREILGQVASELERRGVALLEEDTDGVFFAVPGDWSEKQERECVAEVAATLPTGLKLEYEGRYAAMLSHEVKNYALLSYDGQLIVRGNAFHSSRSEPFGEHFLRAALAYTLVGDLESLHSLYLKTVSDLRERRYAPREVATVARLTKTYEQYSQKQTGKQNREAVYEALLAAGRRHWRVGERVRYYRAEGGQAVWLPDGPGNDDLSQVGDTKADPNSTSSTYWPASETGKNRTTGASGSSNTSEINNKPSRPLPAYDIANYVALLQNSYVSRLRKAFSPDDFEQLFRLTAQSGLFDKPLEEVKPLWICP